MKTRVIQRGSLLLAVIGFMMFGGECRAFPYRPAAGVSILSEYAGFKDSAPPHTQVWKVTAESAPDGAAILRFFLEASAGGDALCELTLPIFGSTGEIRWKGIGKSGQKKSGTGMLIVPGFPAPCDVLPVDRVEGAGLLEERFEAGGRMFSRSYRVSFAAIGLGEAKAKGWIRVEDPGAAGLIMVTVTDERGRAVVRQLWPANGSWWLYEETPLRRSWLIP